MPDPDLLTQIAEAMADVPTGPWYAMHANYGPGGERDARFIAAARTLLPAAREEIARLREQVQIAREALEHVEAWDDPHFRREWAAIARRALAALSAPTEAKETP